MRKSKAFDPCIVSRWSTLQFVSQTRSTRVDFESLLKSVVLTLPSLSNWRVMAAKGACFWFIPALLSTEMHALTQAAKVLVSELRLLFTKVRVNVIKVLGYAII